MRTENDILAPLAYHIELRDYLKTQEGELWDWFASVRSQADYTGEQRLELLKTTYRLDGAGHPELHDALEEVKAGLNLDIPVTLYQAEHSLLNNAALFFIPGEGHVVFFGPVLTLLNTIELKSVLAHELAHYHLWECEAGEFHVADRLIEAVASDPRAHTSHEKTAQRYRLYTEIFADRGSLRVTGDMLPVIAGLIKIQTGLSQVSAPGYLKQADEIFAEGNVAAAGSSHPEGFIRARALSLWHEAGEKTAFKISAMIEGTDDLDELDLIGQRRVATATRRMIEELLRPKWFQTPTVLAHAKLFFDDFQPASAKEPALREGLAFADSKLRDYLGYVLLDFVTADPDLDEMPLAAAIEICRELDLDAPFEKLAIKELKMKVRDMKRVKEQAAGMLARAEGNCD